MTLAPLVLLALAAAGLLAGFVDAIAGGGGLIALPALLAAGVPPIVALGTNKMQSVIGTGIAATTYWRKGFVSLKALALGIVTAFAASFAGALVVEHVDISLLQVALPVILIAVALYFLVAPKLTDADSHARLSWNVFVPVMGAIVGFWDGGLGPGTGSFLTVGFVALFGLGVTRAAANTKVLNVASNLGALALFIASGHVLWVAALTMAVGQLIGGYLGALTGIRFGARLIKPLVVVISLILAAKLLFIH